MRKHFFTAVTTAFCLTAVSALAAGLYGRDFNQESNTKKKEIKCSHRNC
jgi:hypothetical protein